MTDVVGNAERQDSEESVQQPASAGMLLRQAREGKQMSIQSLASALKVPEYKLQALEEDRWDVLSDAVFTRSLASSVCRFLQVPAGPVLAGLPRHETAKLATHPEGINAPFKEKSLRSLMSSSQDAGGLKSGKWLALLLLASAAGVGLYFLPQWQAAQEQGATVVHEATRDEPLFMPQLQTAPEAPAEPSLPAAQTAATLPAAVVTPALVEPALPVDVVAAPVVSGVSAVTEAAAPAVPAPVALPDGARMLRFSATGESWVQVRDAQRRVVLEKILKSGDVLEQAVTGQPLQVVVGNAGATTLQIDGAAWDLVTAARNNVARFEVK